MVMRLIKVTWLWMLMAGLLITGCGRDTDVEKTQPEAGSEDFAEPIDATITGKIEFVNWMVENPASVERIAEAFQEDYPGVEVELTILPFYEYRNYIISRNSAGMTADVIQMNMPWADEFVKQEVIESLDAYMDGDEQFRREDMIDVPMRPIKGNTYMVPLTMMHFVLYCNTDQFEKAGLALPETWEDMAKAAKRLTDPKKERYGYSLSMSSTGAENGPILALYPLLYSAGGRTVIDGQPNIDSEEVLEMMTFVDDLYEEGVIAPGALTKNGTQVIDDFTAGKASMMIQPSVHIATVRSANPDLKFDVVRVPGPKEGTVDATRLHGFELGIGSKSENPELAWLFISWMTSPENNGWIAESMSQMPANVRADTSYLLKDELLRKTYAMMNSLELVEELMFTPETTESWRIFTDHTQKMFLDEQTPGQAIASIQAAWEDLFSE